MGYKICKLCGINHTPAACPDRNKGKKGKDANKH